MFGHDEQDKFLDEAENGNRGRESSGLYDEDFTERSKSERSYYGRESIMDMMAYIANRNQWCVQCDVRLEEV